MILSYSKVNIFLKILNRKENDYHQIFSRFVKNYSLFDTITFSRKSTPNDKFIINGNFDCSIQQNTIYKAYMLLKEHTKSSKLIDFFKNYQVNVDKKIPSFAGLGGGSSNCASFLLYINKILDLNIKEENLCNIGQKIGSDIVFFIKNYDSANVYEEGEIVKRFEEERLKITTYTPNIKCSTQDVFQEYKKQNIDFFNNQIKIQTLEKQDSKEILKTNNAIFLNDLYTPAISLYPSLEKEKKEHNFFSGSGSSFFWLE